MDTRQNYGPAILNYFAASIAGFYLLLWLGKQAMTSQAPAG